MWKFEKLNYLDKLGYMYLMILLRKMDFHTNSIKYMEI